MYPGFASVCLTVRLDAWTSGNLRRIGSINGCSGCDLSNAQGRCQGRELHAHVRQDNLVRSVLKVHSIINGPLRRWRRRRNILPISTRRDKKSRWEKLLTRAIERSSKTGTRYYSVHYVSDGRGNPSWLWWETNEAPIIMHVTDDSDAHLLKYVPWFTMHLINVHFAMSTSGLVSQRRVRSTTCFAWHASGISQLRWISSKFLSSKSRTVSSFLSLGLYFNDI